MGNLLHNSELWQIFLANVVLVLAAIAAGYLISRVSLLSGSSDSDDQVGSLVGATLGLLAFVLAFTFGMAASRFEARKQLLLDEVNAIGTLYLRSDFLPGAQRKASRQLLKRYVDIRVEAALKPETVTKGITESETIQNELWSLMLAARADPDSTPIYLMSYITALNDVIDLHSKRVTVALVFKLPGVIWSILYFVTGMGMLAVGYQFGLRGSRRLVIFLVLALTFSAIISLIADLDGSGRGLLKVTQEPLIDLQKKLGPPQAPSLH